jgi:hypothetical protein
VRSRERLIVPGNLSLSKVELAWPVIGLGQDTEDSVE